jgi:hypothetical protein
MTWRPTPRQRQLLRSTAYEGLYGGAAGGGKSEALLAGALRWVNEPHYRALLLRRTYADLERSLIDRSRRMYREAYPNAEYNETKKVWRFPSGALAEERDASRVLALCAAGRAAEARVIATDFLAKHPRSPAASRVRASCGGS